MNHDSTLQLSADEFLESVGAIVVNYDKTQIGDPAQFLKEWVASTQRSEKRDGIASGGSLSKGDEIGTCHLLASTTETPAPPPDEKEFTPDVAVQRECLLDTFAPTI